MIASMVTIIDEHFGIVLQKDDKNVQEFLEDFCYQMGPKVSEFEGGFVMSLFGQKDKNLEQPLGTIEITL